MIDSGALFSKLFSSFWRLLPLFVLAALFKSAWFKGFIGEVMVNMITRLFPDKHEYHPIKNVTIPTENGSVMVLRTSIKGPNAGNQFWSCSVFATLFHLLVGDSAVCADYPVQIRMAQRCNAQYEC